MNTKKICKFSCDREKKCAWVAHNYHLLPYWMRTVKIRREWEVRVSIESCKKCSVREEVEMATDEEVKKFTKGGA